ncbi:hypothetical protein GCM10022223_26730 [Kineosporia mesophila]|uniref:Uncharacterized protein n=1 Tax=Kineosporia mesophila TaxID=566012 RepID=A0ABP6ZHB1_9ACTN
MVAFAASASASGDTDGLNTDLGPAVVASLDASADPTPANGNVTPVSTPSATSSPDDDDSDDGDDHADKVGVAEPQSVADDDGENEPDENEPDEDDPDEDEPDDDEPDEDEDGPDDGDDDGR